LAMGRIHSPIRRAACVCAIKIPLVSQRPSVGVGCHAEYGSLADQSRVVRFGGILARSFRLIVSTATP
jgi:hypothetical protein